ncbi:MAG: lipopolysaccharide heptosyltransferase II [Gammaproteobacteria bacterium]|nr:lipopolysaccharide heptosyltransferase II [Gammaproteobacteria bacterium]
MTHKILIISPNWVGDIVMSQTLFKLLKQQNPNVTLDVLAPQWAHPLLQRMPEVNHLLILPFRHGELGLKKRRQIGQEIRKNQYDQAIVLPNSFKSALVPFFAKIPKRTGWRGEWRYHLLNDVRILNKKNYPLMIERFMALGLPPKEKLTHPYPIPQLDVNIKNRTKTLKRFHLADPSEKPILALCPGAQFGPSKRWPAQYYAKVAREKLAQGWQIWIFGAQSDAMEANEIQLATKNHCINLVGQTTLDEAIDLLSWATVVITNDSGLMHMAAALNLPLIAIYGSSSPNFTPPLGTRIKILTLNLSCSPCFKRECPLQHFHCMLHLKPPLVLKAIDEMGLLKSELF